MDVNLSQEDQTHKTILKSKEYAQYNQHNNGDIQCLTISQINPLELTHVS